MYQTTISSSMPVLAYIGIELMAAGTVGLVIFITPSLVDRGRKKRLFWLMSIIFALIIITGPPYM